MFDSHMRRLIDPPLDRIGRRLAGAGIAANTVTVAGFAVGLLAIPLLAAQWYGWALAAILLNRLADGLDGAVARHATLTDFGGYLDIVCDFIVYAGVAFGFALARPENALPAAFLILSFVGTGTTFLAFAILASEARGRKSLYYLGGLTEGTETIAVFTAFCLFPSLFPALAYIFGALCWVTTAARVAAARRSFG
jgi:phosphatidylglycerophosphate synthase